MTAEMADGANIFVYFAPKVTYNLGFSPVLRSEWLFPCLTIEGARLDTSTSVNSRKDLKFR